MKTLMLFLLALAAFMFSPLRAAPESTQRQLYVMEMQDRVKSKLKDPDSAQFRNAFYSEAIGVPVTCGEVNSKNSLGGYVGFQRFIAGGDLLFLETQMAAGEMDKSWKLICGR